MAVPLKRRRLVQEALMVAVLLSTFLMMLATYWARGRRIHFIVRETEPLNLENVGHESSIRNLRGQYLAVHKELAKLREDVRLWHGMSQDPIRQTIYEHAPLAAEKAAQAEANAKANAADPPVRADQVINDDLMGFVDETIVRDAVDA